jgi:hypothetical protein
MSQSLPNYYLIKRAMSSFFFYSLSSYNKDVTSLKKNCDKKKMRVLNVTLKATEARGKRIDKSDYTLLNERVGKKIVWVLFYFFPDSIILGCINIGSAFEECWVFFVCILKVFLLLTQILFVRMHPV